MSGCHRHFKNDILDISNNDKGNEHPVEMVTQGHTPSYHVDATRYMDMGGIDHLTSEMDMISDREPYEGHDS
jgi:hypothetical protein